MFRFFFADYNATYGCVAILQIAHKKDLAQQPSPWWTDKE